LVVCAGNRFGFPLEMREIGMKGKFASETQVSPEKSRAEIEKILQRYGADHYGHMLGPDKAVIAFEANGRRLRFVMPLPSIVECSVDARGYSRTAGKAKAAMDRATRQRWRALCLVIKAKLESVESGVATFEEEFMANIVMPSGQTMAELALPQITQAYATGKMPPLLGFH